MFSCDFGVGFCICHLMPRASRYQRTWVLRGYEPEPPYDLLVGTSLLQAFIITQLATTPRKTIDSIGNEVRRNSSVVEPKGARWTPTFTTTVSPLTGPLLLL